MSFSQPTVMDRSSQGLLGSGTLGIIGRVEYIEFECRVSEIVTDDTDNAWLTENRWMAADGERGAARGV